MRREEKVAVVLGCAGLVMSVFGMIAALARLGEPQSVWLMQTLGLLP